MHKKYTRRPSRNCSYSSSCCFHHSQSTSLVRIIEETLSSLLILKFQFPVLLKTVSLQVLPCLWKNDNGNMFSSSPASCCLNGKCIMICESEDWQKCSHLNKACSLLSVQAPATFKQLNMDLNPACGVIRDEAGQGEKQLLISHCKRQQTLGKPTLWLHLPFGK